MDGPRDYHTTWSQAEKDKYHMTSLKHMESLKWYKWTYFKKQKKIHLHRKQAYGYQRGKEWGERYMNRSSGLTETQYCIYNRLTTGPTVQHKKVYSISYNNL